MKSFGNRTNTVFVIQFTNLEDFVLEIQTWRMIQRKAEMQAKLHIELIPR